jgi:hypothetical protein
VSVHLQCKLGDCVCVGGGGGLPAEGLIVCNNSSIRGQLGGSTDSMMKVRALCV